jgi:DNA-binding NtrC family response regulator
MEATPGDQIGCGPLKGLRVLVVEDVAVTAYHIEMILLENGGRLAGTCSSTASARRVIDEAAVDFALIDMKLDDDFADDLIDELIQRGLPFAILTGLVSFPSNVQEHAVAVLRKPIEPKALVDLLAKFA